MPLASQPQVTSYSYRVKVINPRRKKEAIVRELRQFHGKFKSITEIKVRLMEELESYVPETTRFDIGYIEGSTKRWICCEEDIQAMYKAYKDCPQKEITLWCDGRGGDECSEDTHRKRRRVESSAPKSKREEKEDHVKELTEELQALHGDNLGLSEVQFRLWARMIENGVHVSKETPPQIPMITGSLLQRKESKKKETLQDTLINTAAAVVKAVTQNSPNSSIVQSPQLSAHTVHNQQELGISPGKATDIRTKSYSQLSTLKQLYDDCILTREEFEEQKKTVLAGLKKL